MNSYLFVNLDAYPRYLVHSEYGQEKWRVQLPADASVTALRERFGEDFPKRLVVWFEYLLYLYGYFGPSVTWDGMTYIDRYTRDYDCSVPATTTPPAMIHSANSKAVARGMTARQASNTINGEGWTVGLPLDATLEEMERRFGPTFFDKVHRWMDERVKAGDRTSDGHLDLGWSQLDKINRVIQD